MGFDDKAEFGEVSRMGVASRMRRFLLDIAIIFAGAFLFSYLRLFVVSGFEHFDKWLLPLLYGIYFGAICSLIFTITIRVLHSRKLFFFFSWSAVLATLYFDIQGAKKINLTLREMGLDVFVSGKITTTGILYEIFDPLGLMAIFATVLLANQFRKDVTARMGTR